MKNLFGWMLAALLALTVGVSCSDDDDLNEGAGRSISNLPPKAGGRL